MNDLRGNQGLYITKCNVGMQSHVSSLQSARSELVTVVSRKGTYPVICLVCGPADDG
jgi:hypothetical protein